MIGGGKENDRQDKKSSLAYWKNRYFTMYGLGNNLDLSFRAFSVYPQIRASLNGNASDTA